MRNLLILFIGLVLFNGSFVRASDSLTRKQFAEYLGYSIWKDLKDESFSMQDILEGMKKADRGEEISLDPKSAQKIFLEICDRQHERELLQNLSFSENYLKELKKREDLLSLEEGKLFVEILAEGQGSRLGNSGLFHLRGKYLDGEFCMNTYAEGAPLYQALENSILGFQRGAASMREGEKRKLFIHPDLAYGSQDISHPNSLLILEVELLKVID